MLQTSLSKAVLDQAARQLKKEVTLSNQSAMKKGLKLYREGFVYNAAIVQNGVIQANVLDENVYKPTIYFTHLSQSHCQCSHSYVCPHLLALFFYLYSHVGQIGELIREWNTKRTGNILPLTKARELVTPSSSVRNWINQFQKAYHLFFAKSNKGDYAFIHQLCYRFFPSLLNEAPMLLVEKRLYHLHAALFTFCRLLEEGRHYQHISYYRSFWIANVSEFMETIKKKCEDLAKVSIPKSFAPLLEESREYVRHILFAGDALMDERIAIYQMVWNVLFHNEEWNQQEKEWLLQRQEERGDIVLECQLALAHLAFLRGDDEETFSLLKKLKFVPIPYVIIWIKNLIHGQQWERLKHWWELCITSMESYLAATNYSDGAIITRELLYLYDRYAKATGDDENYEILLQVLLPYSAFDYSYFLLTSKQYKKWVDLHLLADIDVNDIHRSFLKVVETHDRSLLLPLYHHAVHKMIQLKNRESYKMAVKHLKKLRTYYRALGKKEVWNRYITKLVEEHKRLRAFQEEIQKGKLLNDQKV
ncbi:hypothetical protein [Thermaerobacillus caldiproteolyticus]|uniref:hypothetical protein n=1 Tax=Thermaerobacillus caldiproteolyticus TaxID=247480 RepID=UPI0018F21B00|nr:hypothetical protein [Anoxybacillus caldiproteolyticus]